jgi:hypothetical protein
VHRLLGEQCQDGRAYVAPTGPVAGVEAAPTEVPVMTSATATVSVGVSLEVPFSVPLVAALAVFCVVVHQGCSLLSWDARSGLSRSALNR